jgi:arylformamidase
LPPNSKEIHRDLAYTEPADASRRLDVYAPADGQNRPVLVWIHGGGWRQGDKSNVQHKPQAFADRGFVFVSVNYRFVPQVTVKEMTGDIAKAIKWVRDHAKQYRGAPDSIFVAGHSAGAHLAAAGLHGRQLPRSGRHAIVGHQGLHPGRYRRV